MLSFARIAHRGASGSCPENTRVAFERAIEAGADMVEMDCQLSKDGHVVVFHDERLDRITGVKGFVGSKTLKQLRAMDAGRWFKKSFKGEKILTLEEALDIVKDRADLNLEIKVWRRGQVGIEIKILFILSHYDYLDRTIITSFNYDTLARLRELAPEARIGILYAVGGKEDPFQAARRLGACCIQVQKELLNAETLARAREIGLRTYVWTVNEPPQMERYTRLGVDGIISDYPERFWKLKGVGR
jgi:glycerophosphoryl diester phosphodiesterase